MKGMAMRTKFAIILVAALVAVLAFSGVALAATFAVTKKVPTGGATGIAPTANVKAYFNHNIKASTVTSSTFKIKKEGTTNWLGATRSVNNTLTPTSTNGSSESVATLNPSSDLASNTTYKVVLVGGPSGVKDSNGNALSANKSWTFTTVGAPTSLTVLSYAPPPSSIDTSTDPSPSTNVTATFSKDGNTPTDMLATSITANTFWLTWQGDPANHVTAQVTYDPATKKATLDPDGLQGGSTYTATIKGGSEGVKDTQGGSLTRDFSWTFHTTCSGGIVYSAQSIVPQIGGCDG
jgi:Bacterial Ig-like domain